MPWKAAPAVPMSLNNALAREVLKTPMRELDEALDMIFGASDS